MLKPPGTPGFYYAEINSYLHVPPQTANFMSVSSASEAELPACLRRTYDVIHDKGTYDAVSLSPEKPKEERLR